MNFCTLPVLVLGRGPKTKLLGTLKPASRSRDRLDAHFLECYGPDRWSGLRAALLAPAKHVAWLNPRCDSSAALAASALQRCEHKKSGCTLLLASGAAKMRATTSTSSFRRLVL